MSADSWPVSPQQTSRARAACETESARQPQRNWLPTRADTGRCSLAAGGALPAPYTHTTTGPVPRRPARAARCDTHASPRYASSRDPQLSRRTRARWTNVSQQRAGGVLRGALAQVSSAGGRTPMEPSEAEPAAPKPPLAAVSRGYGTVDDGVYQHAPEPAPGARRPPGTRLYAEAPVARPSPPQPQRQLTRPPCGTSPQRRRLGDHLTRRPLLPPLHALRPRRLAATVGRGAQGRRRARGRRRAGALRAGRAAAADEVERHEVRPGGPAPAGGGQPAVGDRVACRVQRDRADRHRSAR